MKPTSRPFLLPATAAVLLALLFTACQSLPTRTTTDLGRLQGDWEGRGPGGECSVSISANSLRFYARPDFWYETAFVLPADTDPKQLHATILKDSSTEQAHIGTVVVAIFKIEGEALTLGVIEDFEEPPENPVVGDWERAMDVYHLERARSRENPE